MSEILTEKKHIIVPLVVLVLCTASISMVAYALYDAKYESIFDEHVVTEIDSNIIGMGELNLSNADIYLKWVNDTTESNGTINGNMAKKGYFVKSDGTQIDSVTIPLGRITLVDQDGDPISGAATSLIGELSNKTCTKTDASSDATISFRAGSTGGEYLVLITYTLVTPVYGTTYSLPGYTITVLHESD